MTGHAALRTDILVLILFLGVGWGLGLLAFLNDWLATHPWKRRRARRANRHMRRRRSDR